MLAIDNRSPFAAAAFPLANRRGEETIYVVVKGTFALVPGLAIAEQQEEVVLADEYRGDPERSSLRLFSEAHPEKPGTDVVLEAEAISPKGKPCPHLDVGVTVAGRSRMARVFGDRLWQPSILSWAASPPAPFVSMPLIYENAYGGQHELDDPPGRVLTEGRNPVGKGFAGNRSRAELLGSQLPNIEDPSQPISSPKDKRSPVGFGPIAPHWLPRFTYAGTYDEHWQEHRAPILPEDFDDRFLHVAPPEMIFQPWLQGGEPVAVLNMSRQGRLSFKLPRCELRVEVSHGSSDTAGAPRLETVYLMPTQEKLCMTWRAAAACPMEAVRDVNIRVNLDRADVQ